MGGVQQRSAQAARLITTSAHIPEEELVASCGHSAQQTLGGNKEGGGWCVLGGLVDMAGGTGCRAGVWDCGGGMHGGVPTHPMLY